MRLFFLLLLCFFFLPPCLVVQVVDAAASSSSSSSKTTTTTKTFIVTDYGVIGDGIHDDTTAMRRLLLFADTHATTGNYHKRIVIPDGYIVKTFPLNITSETTLQVDGKLVAIDNALHWPIIPPVPIYGTSEDTFGGFTVNQYQPFVYIVNAHNIRLTGAGIIDGNGPYWWNMFHNRSDPLRAGGRPNLLQTLNSSNIVIDTITFQDSPFWTIHPILSNNIHIHHIKIRAPMYSPNVDGIDPDSCQDVVIEHNDVACGDDHIAIKAGVCGIGRTTTTDETTTNIDNQVEEDDENHDLGGDRYVNHCTSNDWKQRSKSYLTRNITIRHNIFKTGMGIAVGSESSGSIQDVYIYNNTVGLCNAGHDDEYKSCGWGPALHIKTTVTRSGHISNIYYDNNTIYNTSMFVLLETSYQSSNKGIPPNYPKTQVSNIYFRNNQALAHAKGANFLCDEHDPCHEIYVINNTIAEAAKNNDKHVWGCRFIDSYHVRDNTPAGLEECMANSMNKTSQSALAPYYDYDYDWQSAEEEEEEAVAAAATNIRTKLWRRMLRRTTTTTKPSL